jgi:hypothetical protein
LGQEFIIKSQGLEDKINQLLPSQGGFQAGVDLSASTTVIPIVDLTETAEGSNLRQDLQRAFSLVSITAFNVANTSSTLINTTGYHRVFGNFNCTASSGAARDAQFSLTDGTTTKIITKFTLSAATGANNLVSIYDFIVFLQAGDSLTATSNDARSILAGSTRQIADINGNLVNPL